jgi:hypothetical protein
MGKEKTVNKKPKEEKIKAKETGTERKRREQNPIFINLNHNTMYL